MKIRIFITLLIVFLLSSCGQPSYAVNAPDKPAVNPLIGIEQAERTAQAARDEAEFYSRLLTATAEAPIISITSTAAAFAMQQEFSRATQQAQMATETAAMTSTAMQWTPTANATSTMVAIQVQAQATQIANQVEMDNLKVERERTMNFVKAISLYVVGFGVLLVALMFGIGLARKASVFVVPSDERGNPQPILMDGFLMDIDRASNGMMGASKTYLNQLPAISAERQDAVTHHDQLIDLKTRSAAVRKLEANLRKQFPEPKQLQVTNEAADDDLNLPLPPWDFIKGWDGDDSPLGFGRQGLITSKSASPHLLIAGKTGSGKTRYMMRTVAVAALAKGELVINLGSSTVGFGVFETHPNYHSASMSRPEDIVPCLQHIYEELKERKAVIGGMDTDWQHWGSEPPRPFVTLLMDELGNIAEDIYYHDPALNREMWSLIARIGNEGRKVGIRFAAALQDPTSKSMDLRFRRNCTLLSFQLGDLSHSNAFLGSGGAEQLNEGRFMVRKDTLLIGGGFSPTDEEITEYLGSRRVMTAEPSRWIDGAVIGSKRISPSEPLAISDQPVADDDKSELVLKLHEEGKSNTAIVYEIWGKSGSNFSERMEQVKAILSTLRQAQDGAAATATASEAPNLPLNGALA